MKETDAIIERMEREIRPRINEDIAQETPYGRGLDCCGCSTYDEILDAAIAIVRSELDG